MIRPRVVLFSLGVIALTAFIVAFSRMDAIPKSSKPGALWSLLQRRNGRRAGNGKAAATPGS